MTFPSWDDTLDDTFDDTGDGVNESSQAKHRHPHDINIVAVGVSVGAHLMLLWLLFSYTPATRVDSNSSSPVTSIQLKLLPQGLRFQESSTDDSSANEISTAKEPEPAVINNEIDSVATGNEPIDDVEDAIEEEKPQVGGSRKSIMIPSSGEIRHIIEENASHFLRAPCEQENGIRKRFFDCVDTGFEQDHRKAETAQISEFYEDLENARSTKNTDKMQGVFTDFTATGNGSALQHQMNSQDSTYRMMNRVFGYP